MAKKTGAQKAAETRARRNPLTGGEPNTFTQVTDRTLPESVNVRQFAGDGRERSRLRAMHVEATKPGGVVDAQIGYGKPEGMSDRHFAWVAGAHHMFPNVAAEQGNPAINEPHAGTPGVTVQRRAEDLSGQEYRKGTAVLAHYGHDAKDPMGSLVDTQQRTLNRVIAEHAQAGVEESSSHKFYGGSVNTDTGDDASNEEHFNGVGAANGRFRQSVREVAMSPHFRRATAHMSHPERMKAATNVMAQATADTSPNAKWRDNDRWPNIEQAEESVHAALTGSEPKFVTGRIQNVHKAASRVAESVQTGNYGVHDYGNPKTSAKTVAFRGALVDMDSPDAYKVSDVHEASVVAPGLPTAKAQMHTGGGKTTMTPIHPDTPKSTRRNYEPVMDAKTGKVKKGLSRPEEMLAKGGSYVHALNDRASREVLANSGLSRGVNYADNLHAMQAAAWGSQQMLRKDVNVSHADQYPVVRDWAHEGANVPRSNDVLGDLRSGNVSTHMGAQFRVNPNTENTKNPTRTKPYPVMPGD